MSRKDRRAAAKRTQIAARQASGEAADSVGGFFAKAVGHHQAGALDEAERGYRRALDLDPGHADSLHYLGVIAHQRGRNDVAAELIGKAIAANNRDSQSHYHFAIVADALGRPDEAIAHYRQAIALFPSHVNAHLNLAVALLAKRQWEEAMIASRQVLELAPNHPGACNSLGLAFQGTGRLVEAAQCFDTALQLSPNMIEALNNRARLHIDAGTPGEALPLLVRALGVRETDDTKRRLADCFISGKPIPATDAVHDLVLRAFLEGWTDPDDLAGIVESFIKIGPAKEYLRLANDAWPKPLAADQLFGSAGFQAMARDPLLRSFLETTRNSDVELERLLTASRTAMLERAAATAAGDLEQDDELAFAATLARQCFINEYIWCFADEEMERARQLRDRLIAALKLGAAVPAVWVAAVGAYFPLRSLDGADALLDGTWPTPIAALLTAQIRECREEESLRASMRRLTPIDDPVSLAVQQQYEENPFPRWTKLAQPGRPKTLDGMLGEMFPLAGFVPLEKDDGVEFLIAGCGTGHHSIERAQAFSGVRFLAIDLSLASLGYAKRKTQELGIENIDYAQADIVKLGSIGRTFDAIETSGVLVAIGDPWEAWRTLLSLLRPGGVMSVGLYSETARRNIVAAQKYLAERGYRANNADMRRGRQDILALDDSSPVKKVTVAIDFFNMSNCRDMLFHVQEHRFTLPQIKRFLAENGLEFLGFALDASVLKRYDARYPNDPARTNLDHWHEFEQENPDTFFSMYQFWIQKPRPAPGSTEAHG